ncbi:MAG: hypothetical protein SFW35_00985 [Chitinophagales bacterium]|nr:hypothetical protein [Chitinophagales bacterium]
MEPKESYKDIKGWAVDTDRENDPTYPMRKRENPDDKGLTWERPPQQEAAVEVLHSNERPSVSAVFGTPQPPRGLSGVIRRYAFRYSEGSWGHWIPLLLADRVDEMEGIVDDLKNGHVPNLWKEYGWDAQWKYNRSNAIKKVAATVVIASAVVGALYLIASRKKD